MKYWFSKRQSLFLCFLLTTFLLIGTGFTSASKSGIDPKIKPGFSAIKAEDVSNYLHFLASNYLEGRETARKGLHIAGDYVASLYQLWGVKPAGEIVNGKRSYFQYFPVVEYEYLDSSYIAISEGKERKVKFSYGVDFYFGRGGEPVSQSLKAPVVFAGYGLVDKKANYDDLAGLDVKGKIVLILSGFPGEKNPKSPYYRKKKVDRRRRYMMMREKFKKLEEKGAVACFMVDTAEKGMSSFYRMVATNRPYIEGDYIQRPGHRMYIPNLKGRVERSMISLTVSERVANEILSVKGVSIGELKKKIDDTLSPNSFALPGVEATINMEVKGEVKVTRNLLGMVEGSDPVLKNEAIVIGAHYDHLGTRDGYVWNGADDNGSGSVAVMELARAFALNPVKPKRTIIFALWSGEEKGLLGSRYYTEHPTLIPIKKTILNVNMDMIGRDVAPEKFPEYVKRNKKRYPFLAKMKPKDTKRLVNVSGTIHCPILKKIAERANKNVGLIFSVNLSPRPSPGSDHYSFFEHKVPIIYFYSPGDTDYHQPTDTVDKIDFEKIAKVARLIYLITWKVDSLPERLTFKEPAKK
ncbi:MAG: M20/M25/M40 family metallo-hydrolase [Acidobacteria bacterium]|nr:M20/M25/M40 family metallo-hydrolase [Acidobacteriota bacterium]